MQKIKLLKLLAYALIGLSVFIGYTCFGSKTTHMDSEASVQRIRKELEEHVDADKYKVTQLKWFERDKLTNVLDIMILTLVGKDNKTYTQTIKLSGDYQGALDMKESLSVSKKADFATTSWIKPSDLDAGAIVKQIVEAKDMIPEAYSFKSLGSYTLKATDEGVVANFTLRVLEKGKSTSYKKGKSVTTYYDAPFNVNVDGVVEQGN